MKSNNVIKIHIPMDYVDPNGVIGSQAGVSMFDVPVQVESYVLERLTPIMRYASDITSFKAKKYVPSVDKSEYFSMDYNIFELYGVEDLDLVEGFIVDFLTDLKTKFSLSCLRYEVDGILKELK